MHACMNLMYVVGMLVQVQESMGVHGACGWHYSNGISLQYYNIILYRSMLPRHTCTYSRTVCIPVCGSCYYWYGITIHHVYICVSRYSPWQLAVSSWQWQSHWQWEVHKVGWHSDLVAASYYAMTGWVCAVSWREKLDSTRLQYSVFSIPLYEWFDLFMLWTSTQVFLLTYYSDVVLWLTTSINVLVTCQVQVQVLKYCRLASCEWPGVILPESMKCNIIDN